MLIEFSATNFRSVRTKQTISMVPGGSKAARARFSYETGIKQVPYSLKYAGLFGANNTGKSNVVKAFSAFRLMVARSFTDNPSSAENITPFLLDPDSAAAPTELEAVFIADGILFQYGFAVLKGVVVSEWLFATPPGGRLQRWIDRDETQDSPKPIYINPSLAGERKVWIDSTRSDALLLSTAVGLNAKSLSAARDWIVKRTGVIAEPSQFSSRFTAKLCENEKTRVINIMRSCGIDIHDIVLREETPDYGSVLSEDFLKSTPELARPVLRVSFVYKDCAGKNVEMSLNDESDGTKLLFSLIGPLVDVRDNGMLLIADEIHRSLHPLAFRYLLEQFFIEPDRKSSGQLLFTTHETYTLADQLMHADQVYLVGKEGCEGTTLTAASEFKIRAGETMRTGYLAGRYGGLPIRRLPIAAPAGSINDGE
jgi:hypothetical protein